MFDLSIIIPVFNEAGLIAEKLLGLKHLLGDCAELIVVDGGSTDDTVGLAELHAHQVIVSKQKGRAAQMNAGAAHASADLLLFLHIDTQLPSSFVQRIKILKQSPWGFFYVQLDGREWPYRMIEYMINLRSSVSSVATGDQCIFIQAPLFTELKGYENIPLMEDVALSKTLRKLHKPLVIEERVITSSRRWQTFGIWKTILLMWQLRLLYFLGVSPEKLAAKYR